MLPPVVSHNLLHREGLSAVIKHPPASGIQQQLGEFSWDLGSGECEELWQQQGLELGGTWKGSHGERDSSAVQQETAKANSHLVLYITRSTRSHSEFQLAID